MRCSKLRFEIERSINGRSREAPAGPPGTEYAAADGARSLAARAARSVVNSSGVAKPIDYMLRRWDRFARFVNDGRICLTNNAAELDEKAGLGGGFIVR